MKFGTHGPKVQQQPAGTVRRSQVVTTFGPGSMVDLLTDAVLMGGLDFWNYDRNFALPHVSEKRLRDAIVERFRELGRELSQEAPFRAPPMGNDREPSKFAGVSVLEFPHWFVCQNPRCRALQRKDGLDLKNHRYWHQCNRDTKAECVPVRFVSACKRGHIDEFHWISFVHAAQAGDGDRADIHARPGGDVERDVQRVLGGDFQGFGRRHVGVWGHKYQHR